MKDFSTKFKAHICSDQITFSFDAIIFCPFQHPLNQQYSDHQAAHFRQVENQKQNQESLQLDVSPACRKEKTGTRTIPPPGVHEGFSSSSSSRRGILASSQTTSAAEKPKMGQNLLKLFHKFHVKCLRRDRVRVAKILPGRGRRQKVYT